MLDSGERVQIIDARPRHYTTKSQDIMEGAVWRDPERLEEWIGELSKTEPVVTYCVYGFHIGCQTASALRKAGFDALTHAKSVLSPPDVAIEHLFPPYTNEKVQALSQWFEY